MSGSSSRGETPSATLIRLRMLFLGGAAAGASSSSSSSSSCDGRGVTAASSSVLSSITLPFCDTRLVQPSSSPQPNRIRTIPASVVTVSATGLRKFRRNTLSFPQDLPGFAERLQLMKSYRVKDRVNSSRGLGVDPWNPDREIRRAAGASEVERAAFAVDVFGALIFPASVVEVRPNGQLVLEYDGGGRGLEWQSHATPRQAMP